MKPCETLAGCLDYYLYIYILNGEFHSYLIINTLYIGTYTYVVH